MKNLIFTPLLILIVFTVSAQSRQERNVGHFNQVKAGGSFDVFINEGNNEKVVIEADEGPIDKIITEVKGNTLHIYMEDNWWKNYRFENVNIYVTVTELEGVSGSGSGTVRVQAPVKGNDVYLTSSGSGNLICEASVESFDDIKISDSGSGSCKIRSSVKAKDMIRISNSGSGNVYIDAVYAHESDVNNSGSGNLEVGKGNVNRQHIVMSGSGDVKMGDVESEDCHISKSGSGTISIFVTNELSGNSSGSGNIYYKGRAPRMNFSSSGSGKIKSMN